MVYKILETSPELKAFIGGTGTAADALVLQKITRSCAESKSFMTPAMCALKIEVDKKIFLGYVQDIVDQVHTTVYDLKCTTHKLKCISAHIIEYKLDQPDLVFGDKSDKPDTISGDKSSQYGNTFKCDLFMRMLANGRYNLFQSATTHSAIIEIVSAMLDALLLPAALNAQCWLMTCIRYLEAQFKIPVASIVLNSYYRAELNPSATTYMKYNRFGSNEGAHSTKYIPVAAAAIPLFNTIHAHILSMLYVNDAKLTSYDAMFSSLFAHMKILVMSHQAKHMFVPVFDIAHRQVYRYSADLAKCDLLHRLIYETIALDKSILVGL